MLKDNHRASTTLPERRQRHARPAVRLAWAGAAAGVLALALTAPGCTTAGAGAAAAQAQRREGFERLLQAVVRIDVRELDFAEGARRYTAGVGSGVILSAGGLVVTNAHVATPRAVEISVTLANLERVGATLVGWDHWTDLAVLRLDMKEIERRKLSFTWAEFGDSNALVPTQTVFAVGTPYGLTRTVTKGIISNTDRFFEASDGVRGYETGYFNTWLQTDAPISPGNSGGPLVTEDGRVIGINSRVHAGGENLGFAIPSSTAKAVVAKLVASGKVVRSYIGIVPGALRDLENFYALASNTGMLVASVDPGSPAGRAGLRPGDIVLSIGGAKVDGRFPEQLPPIQDRIANAPVGSTVVLGVKRSAREIEVKVVTEPLESRVGEEWAFERWGMSVRKVSRAFARENRLPNEDGVIVIGTQQAFPADKAGLARGDIVTKVNGNPITELGQLERLYAAFEASPEAVLVEALRNRAVSLFVIKP
jgi:serine protease Do